MYTIIEHTRNENNACTKDDRLWLDFGLRANLIVKETHFNCVSVISRYTDHSIFKFKPQVRWSYEEACDFSPLNIPTENF